MERVVELLFELLFTLPVPEFTLVLELTVEPVRLVEVLLLPLLTVASPALERLVLELVRLLLVTEEERLVDVLLLPALERRELLLEPDEAPDATELPDRDVLLPTTRFAVERPAGLYT